MALMAALSGILGQIAASTGHMGCVALCCLLFLAIAIYLFVVWEKDLNTPKYMLSSFIFNMTQTVNTVRSNRQMLLFLLISSMCEASITIFTFYWAPWITSIVIEEDHHLPYEILFSCFIVTSMLGNYLFQLYTINSSNVVNSNNANSSNNIDLAFQAILITSSVSYFLGAIFQTSFMAFLISIVVQLCMGCYWPAIGYFRGKIIPPELRTSSLTIARFLTMILTVSVLTSIHHSPLMLLATCAALNGAAAYIQNSYMDTNSLRDFDGDDDDEDDSESK